MYGILLMDILVFVDQQKLTFISSVDTGCYLEDLPSMMADRKRCQELKKFMLSTHFDDVDG